MKFSAPADPVSQFGFAWPLHVDQVARAVVLLVQTAFDAKASDAPGLLDARGYVGAALARVGAGAVSPGGGCRREAAPGQTGVVVRVGWRRRAAWAQRCGGVRLFSLL